MRFVTRITALAVVAALAANAAQTFGQPTDQSKPAPSLSMIPANSAAFLHFRVGEIWDSPFGKQVRAAIAKGEPDFEAEAEKRMGVALSNIATATYVFQDLEKESLIMLATTRKPFDKAKFLAAVQPKDPPKMIGDFEVVKKSERECFVIVNDRCFFLSSGRSTDAAVALAQKLRAIVANPDEGPLRAALNRASAAGVIAGGLDVKSIPPIPPGAQIGPPFSDLLPILKAETFAGTIELGDALRLDASAKFSNADDAAKGEVAIKAGIAFLTETVKQGIAAPVPASPDRDLAIQLLNEAKKSLESTKIARAQNDIRIEMTNGGLIANGATLATSIAAMVRTARDSASRTVVANNLKQIGLAMHNYLSEHGTFPPHAIYSKDGKTPLLSWRVAILPYLEQNELYKQFKLDEPWDSEHNKKLIARIPAIYKSPTAAPSKEVGRTPFLAFVGGGAFFDATPKGAAVRDMVDGFSKTLMVVEAQEQVPWTKPDDIRFDPSKPIPKFAVEGKDADYLVLFADGSVQKLSKGLVEKKLKALITRAGNEPIDP